MSKKISFGMSLVIVAALLVACSNLELELPSLAPLIQPEETLLPAAPTLLSPTVAPAQASDVSGLADLQAAYEQIYQRVLPSVVSITVTATVTQTLPSLPFDFDFNFPNQEIPRQFQQRGAGSGFVWDTQGHVVTNNHVIQGADVVRVRFSDGTSALAEVVGADTDSDLAVLEVDVPVNLLKPVELADSTQVKVGQIAVAIGNPFQLEGSMTTGIISGTGRSLALEPTDTSGSTYSIPDVIQTDAAINPGNSGGVLVDINGRLIGVTTAIESPVRGNAGVGYVVPSAIVQKVVPILIEEGDYQHPYIGISGTDLSADLAELMDLPASQRGALVLQVNPGSPADEAGLRGSDRQASLDGQDVNVGGDVITAINGQVIEDFEDLVTYLARYAYVDETIILTVLRNGQAQDISLTLAARPGRASEQPAQTPREISAGGWLGITGVTVTPTIAEAMDFDANTSGVLVQQVTADGPADEAGLRGSYKPMQSDGQQILVGGDIITAVDDSPVTSVNELSALVSAYEPGTGVMFSILRDGEEMQLEVQLGERPAQ